MSSHAAFTAIVELTLMLAVVAAYVLLARRFRVLWNPLSIVLAVGTIGVVVSVLGELLSHGPAGVPAMVQRSAIGSFGWGVLIAAAAWSGRRVLVRPGR